MKIKTFRMKLSFRALLLLPLSFFSCLEQEAKSKTEKGLVSMDKVPNVTIEKAALEYHPEISLWTLNEVPYSGFAVKYYPDATIEEKMGILNGRKQDKHIRFYADGHFKSIAAYDDGKLHGEKKLWSADTLHILIAHYNYYEGKPHGEQKKWYPTGELFKVMHLNHGKEKGIQKAFRKNGAIYANYEAREGRIFGLKKAKLCYSLESETVQTKKPMQIEQ